MQPKEQLMFTTKFWLASLERAVKTFAQTLLSFIVIGTTGLIGFDWAAALSVAGAATLASILTSVASSSVNGSGPSLGAEALAPKHV